MSQCEKNFKILDNSLYSSVQESIQGKISKSTPKKGNFGKEAFAGSVRSANLFECYRL